MKLRYERGALADLAEIFAYIAADNPLAAAELAGRIEEIAARISEMPHLGAVTKKAQFRKFPVGRFLLVYEVTESEVIVHCVRQGARRRPWEGE
jgi:toxin ParE1/3/4